MLTPYAPCAPTAPPGRKRMFKESFCSLTVMSQRWTLGPSVPLMGVSGPLAQGQAHVHGEASEGRRSPPTGPTRHLHDPRGRGPLPFCTYLSTCLAAFIILHEGAHSHVHTHMHTYTHVHAHTPPTAQPCHELASRKHCMSPASF